ncbi:MAG: hypothetical protein H6Q77_2392 [Gemmatimonadetes bacterium]|nr:hypothetical protein [Gemmatimonadota bacterium]
MVTTPRSPGVEPVSAVDELCRSYFDVRWHFDPAAASAAGRTAQDGRLGRFDADSVREHLAAVRSLAGAAEELEVEDYQEEIDRTALLDDMRVLGFRFDYEEPHRRNPAFWLRHLRDAFLSVLGRPDDAAAAGVVAERLRDIPSFLDAAVNTLDRPAGIFTDTALSMLGGTGEVLVEATRRYSLLAPELKESLDAGTVAALSALKSFGVALGQRVAPSPDPHAFAAGEEEYERRLRFEHALLASAQELWRYGLHLRDELEAQLAALSRRLDPSRPWRDVAERLLGEAPDPSARAAFFDDEMARAVAFIESRALVTLPDEPGQLLLSGDRWEHATHRIPVVVAHEVWPGRHLHAAQARRLGSEVRRQLASTLTVSGWALYAQDLMAEEGYYKSLETRLMHLVGLLKHAVQVDVDIGLHTRGMTPQEAIDELVKRVPIERRQAEAEVRGYCEAPAQALCHAVGRRALNELRDAAQAQRGAAFSMRGFHDEVLSYGGLPVSLIRWGMGID